MNTRTFAAVSAAVGAAGLATMLFAVEPPAYPVTKKIDHVDDYHGTKVADPYRWLEDETSPETAAWVEAQNAVTFPYLERIPNRDALRARVMELNDYERYGAPARKGPYFFFSKNEGLQNQSVLYIQQGLDGAPNVLLDPNSWSADGTVQLSAFEPSKDAKYAVYGISQSGSDWQQYKVMELATKRTLADTVDWAKVSSVAWHGDGFYYSRYPEPPEGHEKASINENHQVFFHKLGAPQSADALVFEDPANPQRFHTTTTTEDERFLILEVSDRGKGLELDGNNPTLLYGYGGFNIVVTPTFSAARIALLEQGFVYASANLRGGAEYGEAWHRQGMKAAKQNVFDDFIAAGEWLIKEKYTSTPRLAITGRSNGGLLVGAVLNQRPDLFGAAVPEVGVMDMLRFHKFTIGWNWIADYGSSEVPEEFEALYAYSPLHNIRAGAKYPPTLVTTADHDDRVVPAHSFKYAATLQALASHENPILIRIETKSGHGASSLTKQLEATADIYAFLMHNLGVEPKVP